MGKNQWRNKSIKNTDVQNYGLRKHKSLKKSITELSIVNSKVKERNPLHDTEPQDINDGVFHRKAHIKGQWSNPLNRET